ncbi:unnamed protein product [Mytilus coruscus]|uniref:Uncharacterized protein n=1 Tax=Mytilus coruscus TaxID=42192 RepID=A0A6J8ATB2_MYTCO|nr:unnamed protein product [Mytilus coruscus]
MKLSSLLLVAFLFHSGTNHDCVIINVSDSRADCHNQNLTGIPQDLPIDIEFLDLSENNLGVISNKSFVRYSHLKTLELQNSKIHTLEPEGFDGLNSLENLSLAGNALNISTDGLFILKISKILSTLTPVQIRIHRLKLGICFIQMKHFNDSQNYKLEY